MKANSLSICVPLPRDIRVKNPTFCNKDCPYCISKMTGFGKVDEGTFQRNLPKVKRMADLCQVNSVIFTGKTEPLLNMKVVEDFSREFKAYPLEIQTNGKLLSEDTIRKLATLKFNVLAISIDSFEQLINIFSFIPAIHYFGMTVRLTINVVKDFYTFPEDISYTKKVQSLLDSLQEKEVDQVSFRGITKPSHPVDTEESRKAQAWIDEHIDSGSSRTFLYTYEMFLQNVGMLIKRLPSGTGYTEVYMYKGMSCTSFPYCIQDANNEDDIRSLIYYEDGHLATTWYGSNFGRIF